MQKPTLFPLYHYSALPFIFPLLRLTGSKIWFPPHNSLHNAILLALNCQDNLYQSGGESTEWLNSYFSGRQEPGHVEEIRTGKQLEKSFTASIACGHCLPPPSRTVKPVTNHITGCILIKITTRVDVNEAQKWLMVFALLNFLFHQQCSADNLEHNNVHLTDTCKDFPNCCDLKITFPPG